jgi:hypothetical protein
MMALKYSAIVVTVMTILMTSAYVRMHLQASAQRNSPSLQPSKHVDTNEPVTTQ